MYNSISLSPRLGKKAFLLFIDRKIAYQEYKKIDRYCYQCDHGIGQKTDPVKRRMKQEHRVHVVRRLGRRESIEDQVAVAADYRHRKDGEDDIHEIPFHVDLHVAEQREKKDVEKKSRVRGYALDVFIIREGRIMLLTFS